MSMSGGPVLKKEKFWLMGLVAILALSSLGFAFFSCLRGPELSFGSERLYVTSVPISKASEMPDLEELADFWEEKGFELLWKEQVHQLRRGKSGDEPEAWIAGLETWVFVPRWFEEDFGGAVLELCGQFVNQGWLIQIEACADGYQLGFWGDIPGFKQKVPVYSWRLETLNPGNYASYKMGFIPVMGELFDPYDLERGTRQAPVLAVIVDDWGYNTDAARPLLDYPFPLTIAVLPHLILSEDFSERADQAGHEVILHQPMEAQASGLDLGPGGITVDMDAQEIELLLLENLASLPAVVGMNNHMGSRATEDSDTMKSVLQVIKDQDLFFVDSSTSSNSIAPQVAKELGVPFSENNLFIDNENDVEKIKIQLRKGLDLAKKRGHAVVIGHVRWQTALALWEMIPELLASGVDFVPVSSLVNVR